MGPKYRKGDKLLNVTKYNALQFDDQKMMYALMDRDYDTLP